MKGLLIKDLKLLMLEKKVWALILVMLTFWTIGSEDVILSANCIMMILSLMTLSSINYDEKNGGMLFLLSLPTTRKLYVKEKYLFAFLNLVVATLLTFAICFAAITIRQSELSAGSLVVNIAAMMFLMGVVLSVAMGLSFKLGAEKGRIIVSMVATGIALAGIVGMAVLRLVFHTDLPEVLAKLFGDMRPEGGFYGIVIGGFFAAMLAVLCCSYYISNRVMGKREF